MSFRAGIRFLGFSYRDTWTIIFKRGTKAVHDSTINKLQFTYVRRRARVLCRTAMYIFGQPDK